MKKLGTIICIALMLTVGGVYATFNYAQTTAGSVEETVGHTIEGAVTNTAKGTIGLVSNYAIEVVNAGNNKTGYSSAGTTTVTFTPAAGADADVRDNGIKLKLTIEITGTKTYNGTDIFVLKTAYTDGGVILNGGNEVNGTITVDLSDYITISEITLSTYAEYVAYEEAFRNTTVKFIISEYVAG